MAEESLLDLLLNRQSGSDRLMSLLPLLQAGGLSSGGGVPSMSTNGTPFVPGAFGNSEVDVLLPGDPRLRSGLGVTLARPAMKSLRGIARNLGLQGVDWGGGYRSPAQQRAAIAAGRPAAPEGQSFHQEGLAIDLAAALQNARVEAALRAAGWNQLPSEPWHWSYGVSG